jgi:hypothetical protein
MYKRYVLIGLLGFGLLSCNTPTGLILSGRFEPKALQSTVSLGISDTTGHSENQSSSGRVTLVNGQLPSNPFAAQKSSVVTVVGNAPTLDTSKKTELINNANLALDKLETDINAALDSIPRRMKINLTNDRLGDLVNANFEFQLKNGTTFIVSPTNTIIALYNLSSTEFNITSFGFARADGNQNAILGGLVGCQFKGQINQTTATHTCGATGLLGINNVGAIALGVSLTIEMVFTRD